MASFKLKLSLVSAILATLLFLCPDKLFAQSILFQDNFESGISGNWQVIHGSWTTSSDPIYPENGTWLRGSFPSGTDNEIQAGDFNWHNYELSFDILPKLGADRNIFFRVNNTRTPILPGHDLPVSYSLQPTTGQTYLGKWNLSGFGGLPGSPVSIPLNIKSHMSIRLEEQNIKIYLNDSEILNYMDNSNPILFGRIALGVITGSDPSEVWYDNVQVTELIPSPTPTITPTPTPTSTPTPSPTIAPTPTITPTPTPYSLPALNVPDVKQYSSPWGNHLYDSANSWSNNPTINRWGCALTSAVMILRYYGHDVNPDSLNNWLKSQPDGYIGNGLVNWLAISRYTLQHSSSTIPVGGTG